MHTNEHVYRKQTKTTNRKTTKLFFFSFKKMKIGIERKSNDELCWYTYESNRRMWTDGLTDGWI